MERHFMKDEIIAKIKEIATDEKFKADAIFFCGFPTSLPNMELLKACEKYLETVDNATPDQSVTEKLIAELEAAAAAKPKVADVNNIVNNMDQIKEILAHKDLLMA